VTTAAASLVVEFAGLPGSGKTTVAAATRATLLAAGVPTRVSDASISAAAPARSRIRRRLALAAAEVCRHPLRGAGVALAVRRLAPDSSRDAAAGAVQWFAVHRLMARACRTPGVHLLEEGAVQTGWTLALRSRGRPDELLRLLGRSRSQLAERRLLVVVEAPLDLVATRLATRSSRHSRTQLLAEPQRSAELVAGRELLRTILAASDGGHLLVVNDGRESPDELGRRVVGWVLRAGT
jgi:hypothetical protein